MSSTNAQGTGRPNGAAGAPTTITSIPLTDAHPPGDATVGSLVRDATVHMSTLVRAEVELAKTEVVAEAKKALIGSVFFIVALVVLLFSSFFFFFFLADLFTLWMPRWVASLLVFVLMLVTAGLSAGIGVWRVMKIRAPSKTISSLKKVSEVLPTHHGDTEPRLT